MLRTCKICDCEKPIAQFARNGTYYKYICKTCESKRVRQGILKTTAYVQLQKTHCCICGYNKDKSALEFHHLDDSEKLFNLGGYASKHIWSSKVKQQIDLEIKKCICVCSNCHKELHSKEIDQATLSQLDFSFPDTSRSELSSKNYNLSVRRFSDAEVQDIRYLSRDNSYYKIAKQYKCDPKTIGRIVRRETYADVT